MANVLVNENSLTGIADAIRSKNGSTDTYKPSEMAAAISAISGGSGPEIPDSAFVIREDGAYWDYLGKWDTFIEAYKDRWSTSNLQNCSYMFFYSNLANIPFEINIGNNVILSNMLAGVKALVSPPTINANNITVQSIKGFMSSSNIKYIPDNYFDFIVDIYNSSSNISSIFESCNKLRNFPSSANVLPIKSKNTSYTYGFYNRMCFSCSVLDEIINLGVNTKTITNNQFNLTVSYCYRLKNFTFESGKTANWKSQVIDLSTQTGYGGVGVILDNDSYDIPKGKRVTDATTYAALKDDADWWTTNIAYSRYNHDSAVATINSLPDTSAYLATAGGTNTIKFKGAAGSATDGGAINTLTEEEIAVATAKGWSVSLV